MSIRMFGWVGISNAFATESFLAGQAPPPGYQRVFYQQPPATHLPAQSVRAPAQMASKTAASPKSSTGGSSTPPAQPEPAPATPPKETWVAGELKLGHVDAHGAAVTFGTVAQSHQTAHVKLNLPEEEQGDVTVEASFPLGDRQALFQVQTNKHDAGLRDMQGPLGIQGILSAFYGNQAMPLGELHFIPVDDIIEKAGESYELHLDSVKALEREGHIPSIPLAFDASFYIPSAQDPAQRMHRSDITLVKNAPKIGGWTIIKARVAFPKRLWNEWVEMEKAKKTPQLGM